VPSVLYLHAETIRQLIPLLSAKKTGSSIRLIEIWERLVAHRSLALACNSHLLERDVLPVLGRVPNVVFLGCDPVPTSSDQHNPSTILSLTRWDIDRDPSFLLKVLAKTKTRPIQLVVAGHWPSDGLYRSFREQVETSGLRDLITIERDPSESRLQELYATSAAFVFPVRTYVGLGILEAATYGTPMITTTESGIWEMFTEGVHGLAAPEGDVNAYASAIDNILRPEVASEMRSAVKARATQLSWTSHVRALLRIAGSSVGS
jgi:glycosyltransferase involved in cell wall biosynthesis